ncbi:hypothetical protein FE257_000592 [Aspergillus nanangensis]|uniref:NAD-dependent epimerase/dehydratase domain-containing protein n=1 Tax=Aspergillus nanangensis TaxID=2582783 RepID=A0AAD4CF98_ASPNN|nr:hypothetical protein FE257_000592 [Aspergillus nanangensis]
MPQQKFFITGATGYVGSVVTSFAVQAGHDVRGLSRHEKGDALLESLGATPVRGDLTTFDILSAESAKADVVLHLAFDHNFTQPFEQIIKLDADAVEALATPLIGTNKPLVTTGGTAMVVADPNHGETDETAPFRETVIPRHRAEQNSLSWAEKGVRVTSIRLPQYVYGRATEHGFAAQLIKLAVQTGESAYIGDGEYYASTVYVDDAARLYFEVAAKAGAGEIFNGTGCTTTTYKALATSIGKLLDVPVKSLSEEEAVAKWGPFLAGFVGLSNRSSNRKAVEQLGWQPVGPDLLEEIETGSYVSVAKKFREEAAGEA